MSEQKKNALAAAMIDMPAVAELDANNPHKNYKYASADSLYAAVRPALAKHGLTVWFQELDFKLEKNSGGKLFIHAAYELGFQTDPQEPPPEESRERLTMVSPYFDVQSCQAVRTYAQKYWLRSKCLMATGEIEADLDANEQAEQPASKAKKEEQPEVELADPEALQSLLDRTDGLHKQEVLTKKEAASMIKRLSSGFPKDKVEDANQFLADKRNEFLESRKQESEPEYAGDPARKA